MPESGEPSLGRQMQAWVVILARKAATSCLVYCAERSNKRALCNIPVVVAPQLSPWIWRFRHGFPRGPTGFEIPRDLDAHVGKFQLAILQGEKSPTKGTGQLLPLVLWLWTGQILSCTLYDSPCSMAQEQLESIECCLHKTLATIEILHFFL